MMIVLIVSIKLREVIEVAGCSTTHLAGIQQKSKWWPGRGCFLFEKKRNIEYFDVLYWGEGSWGPWNVVLGFGVTHLLLDYLILPALIYSNLLLAKPKEIVYLQPVEVVTCAEPDKLN
jgi:hypothetical protein